MPCDNVSFDWITLDYKATDIADNSLYSSLPKSPGLYKILVHLGGNKIVYIGEASNLSRRLKSYRRSKEPKVTNTLINRKVRKLLCEGGELQLCICTEAKIGDVDVIFEHKYERLLLESFALHH